MHKLDRKDKMRKIMNKKHRLKFEKVMYHLLKNSQTNIDTDNLLERLSQRNKQYAELIHSAANDTIEHICL